MAHQDGRCATDGETIYVQMSSACSNSSGGTSTTPFCGMDPALTAAGATRDLILVRGTVVNGTTSGFNCGTRQISIVGQMSATVSGVPAIHVASGDLYVRAAKLSTGASIGCQADAGSILRLDHVLVTGNSAGGILLNGAAFDIENTTVTTNGPGTDSTGATWGGIRIVSPPLSGPKMLNLVTVQNNNQVGVSCSASASVSGMGVLASGNAGGVDITTANCGFSSCALASVTCGAQP